MERDGHVDGPIGDSRDPHLRVCIKAGTSPGDLDYTVCHCWSFGVSTTLSTVGSRRLGVTAMRSEGSLSPSTLSSSKRRRSAAVDSRGMRRVGLIPAADKAVSPRVFALTS